MQYWELLEKSAQAAGADPHYLGALLTVEGSGERAVSPAGALGLMQLMPDKFRPGDDPFNVSTNLMRAAQHVALLQSRYSSPDSVAAAYFGAVDRAGNVTNATDGNLTGPQYVGRFHAALNCVRSGLGLPGHAIADLLSPLGSPITPAHVSFGFLEDYGTALATYVRGAHGVQQYGTRHLAWDLIIPGAPANGRGHPIIAPMAGRIVRTSDAAGGPFGIWLENPALNLRARLMHMDSLAPGIVTGAQVRAGQPLGTLGAQGTPEFPHLHLSLELLSTGQRIDPASFYFRTGVQAVPAVVDQQALSQMAIAGNRTADAQYLPIRIPALGVRGIPRVWNNTVVWAEEGSARPNLRGYDIDLGWAFGLGGSAAKSIGSPAIADRTVAWLDVRNAVPQADATGTPSLADVYSLDVLTGQERRITADPGHLSDLVISGQQMAWINHGASDTSIEVVDLDSGFSMVVERSSASLSELTISGPLLLWTERATGAPSQDGGTIRGFNLETGQRLLVQEGRASQPAIAGSRVLWQQNAGPGEVRSIRVRDLVTGQDYAIAPAAMTRRGLRASDGLALWEEVTPNNRSQLWLYSFSTGERTKLVEGAAGEIRDAELGSGTVVWRDEHDELAVAYLLDWALPDGHVFAEQAGQGTRAGRVLYRITNQDGIPFWDTFQQLGGASVLGRPLSDRVTMSDGLIYQVTERALLQWRPDLGQVVLANSLELLESDGHDPGLHARWQIPRPDVDDARGDWARALETRLSWLTDVLIRGRFLSNPDPSRIARWTLDDSVGLYGLPMSEPEDFGPFVAQRFQRAVLQRWKTDEPGLPGRDSVTAVQIGSILRELLLGHQTVDD